MEACGDFDLGEALNHYNTASAFLEVVFFHFFDGEEPSQPPPEGPPRRLAQMKSC